jgi:Rad3-related DNA helicase
MKTTKIAQNLLNVLAYKDCIVLACCFWQEPLTMAQSGGIVVSNHADVLSYEGPCRALEVFAHVKARQQELL